MTSFFGWDPLPRTLDAALRDARDPKGWVRLSAVRDLARHAEGPGAEKVRAALLTVLGGDASAEVRGAAAIALADVRAEGATKALLGALSDGATHVRQMALIALGEVGDVEDPGTFPAIERALRDEAAPIRFQALIALGRLARESSEGALVAATSDADGEVRHVSLRLLEERATKNDGTVHASETTLGAARRALGDPVLGVRTAAAILLERSGDRSGDAVIAEACAHRGRGLHIEDEQAAIELSGELGIAGARPGLERRAFGGLFGSRRTATSHAARIALARMGDPRARGSILRSLSAWSRDERTLAVVAAGRARLREAREELEALRGATDRAEPEAVEEALALLADEQ